MALRDEQADILGGPILQRPESSLFASFGQYHFVFKSVTLLGLGLFVWIVCVHGLEHLKKHRELRHRKAMRRKHGIPDSDCRPFAVAYAAAKRAHLEREAQDRKKMATNYVADHHSPVVDQRTDAQKDARGLRKRVPETTVRLHDYQLSTNHATLYDNRRPDVHPLNFADRYNPNSRPDVPIPEPLPAGRAVVRRTGRKEFVLNFDENEESRKRSFEDENDAEHENIKKSRIDGEELIDGDEEADWYSQYSDVPLRQTSKESLHHRLEADYVHTDAQGRSQHINDLHDEDHGPVDEAMEAVGEDEMTELKAVVRGKKRDRTEAGSSFGGDEDEAVRNGRASHHRKRRTVSQRRVEVPARGRKRDREAESPESEGERGSSEASQGRSQRSSKKKREKKTVSDGVKEVLVEDRVSGDSLCGGRRTGEEWEADGVQYKVNDKGERSRLTLVRKARNKYHMPEDSQHPDRSAALEIYVETWMTDEQYKQAERRQELAWQEAPRESKPAETFDSPTKSGKNILWDSVTGSPTRRPFRHLVPASTSTRINPFEQWQLQPTLQGRRVASSSAIVSHILPGVANSPTRSGFRTFSKWEKQDREAAAMARIRAKIEEQKKAQSPPQKSAEMSPSVTAPELGSKPLSVPTITLTPAPPVVVEAESVDLSAKSKTNTSTFFAPPLSTDDSTKNTLITASNATPSFSLSSTSTSASTPSTLFPSASTVPIVTSSAAPLPQFLFAKSSQIPFSTTTAYVICDVNFLRERDWCTHVIRAPARQPSTESASKPATFSFAKPEVSTSSATSSPAVAVPLTTKPQAPIFGVTSTSSLAPVNFGATKAEASAPPVSTSVTTLESSKPATPLFSFSGTSSSSLATTFQASSAPKFTFVQSSTTSAFTPPPNANLGAASQPKPTPKFGLTPTGATDGGSTSSIPAILVPAFGTSTSNELAKPSGTISAGNATLDLPSTSITSSLGKPVATDGGTSVSTPPKPTPASASSTNAFLSIPAGAPTSGTTQLFSLGGTSFGSKATEGSKPASLFGGAAGNPSSVPIFGGSSTEGKPAFTFGALGEGFKPASASSGNAANFKAPSVFGGSVETAKPISVFSGGAEESKATFAFSSVVENKSKSGLATEGSKSSSTTDTFKPNATPEGTASTAPTFAFRKDDAGTDASTSMGAQTKPATSFTFGAPSGATSSIFGQPSSFATNNDPSQSIFGKSGNSTPSAFGFGGTGSSGSSSTFTFGKPAAQNQKQEQ
ncbi:hypothetical protein JVU11DRAFT_1522 [Chiua virens]|nr:hypothetical protein JVU11DRAFT_1522 [Chiua virens]